MNLYTAHWKKSH